MSYNENNTTALDQWTDDDEANIKASLARIVDKAGVEETLDQLATVLFRKADDVEESTGNLEAVEQLREYANAIVGII